MYAKVYGHLWSATAARMIGRKISLFIRTVQNPTSTHKMITVSKYLGMGFRAPAIAGFPETLAWHRERRGGVCMLFNSLVFGIFSPLCLSSTGPSHVLRLRVQNAFLLLVSYLFRLVGLALSLAFSPVQAPGFWSGSACRGRIILLGARRCWPVVSLATWAC